MGKGIRSYDGLMVSKALVSVAVLSVVLLSGCSQGSTNSAEGLEFASSACQLQAQIASSAFDPQKISVRDLSVLDDVATQKTLLASKAAEKDERWRVLAEASTAISAFAARLLEVRLDSEQVNEAISPEMWEQYKTASNAFIAECQTALADLPTP